jgi:hypothetical protein
MAGLLVLPEEGEVVPLKVIITEIGWAAVPGMIFGEMVETLFSAFQSITHEPLGLFQNRC